MSKRVFIAEKPSVAREFAGSLDLNFRSRDGYMETEDTIVTWCVGHLVTMSYPDAYDPKYKKWSLSTIPFIPETYKYQVIDGVKKQYNIVRKILTDKDVDTIYICTDSGREGEYIYRLVAQQAGVTGKRQLRVWIDSQTREEILRGIREAKDDSEYDNLGSAAYLRAKEDYLMGINFSRALTLRYGRGISEVLGTKYTVIAVGRVMTCVLGMVVRREREIRDFVKMPFYRILGEFGPASDPLSKTVTAEWHAVEGSRYFGTPVLYKENGFRERKDAETLLAELGESEAAGDCYVKSISRRKEKKNPPLLYNLAELQNDCSRYFKISPDQTLQAAQELYEKKLTTYPRTDARVLSSAVAKEIGRNLKGLSGLQMYRPYLQTILQSGSYRKIGNTRYTDDKAITDHYAIIPTGQGFRAISSLSETTRMVYELICRRFLAIFYPPAVFDKTALEICLGTEQFSASLRSCADPGYREVMQYTFFKKEKEGSAEVSGSDAAIPDFISSLRRGSKLQCNDLTIKEGETSPPKRYNSGSMILAMENAGQLIEDEDLREQIKGSGIGTSATRADILKKLVSNKYLSLNHRTQIITPTLLGEMIYDTVFCSIRALLDPRLTASWEKGLTMVSDGSVTEAEYLEKLNNFVIRRTDYVKNNDSSVILRQMYARDRQFYKTPSHPERRYKSAPGRKKTGNSASGKTAARTRPHHKQ